MYFTVPDTEEHRKSPTYEFVGKRKKGERHSILFFPLSPSLHVFLAAAIFFLQILFLAQIRTKLENRSFFFYSYETFALLLGKYKCFLAARTLNHYLSLPFRSGPRREREREKDDVYENSSSPFPRPSFFEGCAKHLAFLLLLSLSPLAQTRPDCM